MQLARFTLAAALIAAPAFSKQVDIGPEPNWERAKQVAMETIKEHLRDPDSAKFRWRRDGWSKTKKAWVLCGQVNSKNAYGGYTGYQQFKLNVVMGQGKDWKLAPEGLGFNECNTDQGFAEEA